MKQLFRDLLKAFAIGAASAAAVFAVLFLGGWLFGANGVGSGLEAAKDGLLLLGALGLFIVAGMIMARGKNPKKFSDKEGWRSHFQVVGPETVIGFFSAAFILLASVADYLLML